MYTEIMLLALELQREGENLNSVPGFSASKESTCNAGDLGLVPGLGRSPGEGKGYTLQYFGLENSMDCIYIILGFGKSQK